MKILLLCGLVVLACKVESNQPNYPDFKYPKSKRGTVVDTIHGVNVSDPYRWLEDNNSAETKLWVKQQNQVTNLFLSGLKDTEAVRARLTEVWNFEKRSVPTRVKNRYFFTRNSGIEEHSSYFWTDKLGGRARKLISPSEMSKDGKIALAGTSVSWDGELVAYATKKSGSDWVEWRVKEVQSGKELSDHIKWTKFGGVAWAANNAGFYYTRFAAPQEGKTLTAANTGMQIFYHQLGTEQEKDVLVFEDKANPKHFVGGFETRDGKFLLVSVWHQNKSKLLGKRLDGKSGWVSLIPEFTGEYSVVDSSDGRFYLITNDGAQNRKVAYVDFSSPKQVVELIPEAKLSMASANLVGGKWIISYLKDAKSHVEVFSKDGRKLKTLLLPGNGTARGFSGNLDDTETFFSFTTFLKPSTNYRLDMEDLSIKEVWSPALPFDSTGYETRQEFVTSKDGTKVPVFLFGKSEVLGKRNSSTPVYLYGYGGFDISLTPRFNTSYVPWMERGGLVVVANLRGGGEYGEAWHKAGTKLNKQNVFDDFISVADWLVRKKYTNPARLAISGRSNGGLLVGATMTQCPALFGAAVPEVGVLDMIRFSKFTIGWAWEDDYGDVDVEEEFKALLKYSPYHNVSKTSYPATLITTADHDDRVVPAHSYKFAAALQYAAVGRNPILIKINTSTGHGAGKTTSMKINEEAERWSFLFHALSVGDDVEVGGTYLYQDVPHCSRKSVM